jgi:outer membrane protein TolC
MALTIKYDEAQFAQLLNAQQQLAEAVNNLSTNLGKWQGTQTDAINNKLNDLIRVLGGDTGEDQIIVDKLTGDVKAAKDKLKSSVDSQTKGD